MPKPAAKDWHADAVRSLAAYDRLAAGLEARDPQAVEQVRRIIARIVLMADPGILATVLIGLRAYNEVLVQHPELYEE